MQFASEFEWIAPSGVGLLTHYMPAHYSAGWWMDSAATLQEAEDATLALFTGLKKVTSTRNVLLPVGTDYTPPNKWVTEIHRDWNTALHVATIRLRAAQGVLRRGPRRTRPSAGWYRRRRPAT